MQRGFKCEVREGTYAGTVTVWVDADLIEEQGNEAIERAAWREFRRRNGPPLVMAYKHVTWTEIEDDE